MTHSIVLLQVNPMLLLLAWNYIFFNQTLAWVFVKFLILFFWLLHVTNVIDYYRCREWLRAVGNKALLDITGIRLSQSRYVCACHFIESDFSNMKNLKRSALPSKFEPGQVTPLDDKTMMLFKPGEKTINERKLATTRKCYNDHCFVNYNLYENNHLFWILGMLRTLDAKVAQEIRNAAMPADNMNNLCSHSSAVEVTSQSCMKLFYHSDQ